MASDVDILLGWLKLTENEKLKILEILFQKQKENFSCERVTVSAGPVGADVDI